MIDYLITSTIILLLGVAFSVNPAKKKINKYGYRSKAALANQENWELAQNLAGRLMILNGVIGTAVSIALYTFFRSEMARLAAVVIPILGIWLVIRIVESRLKKPNH